MAKEKGTSICLGCLTTFKHTELFTVDIKQEKMEFQSSFCEKCIKKENFPHNIGYEVKERVGKIKPAQKVDVETDLLKIEKYLLKMKEPVLRKMLSKLEIKVANKLVKSGKLVKGKSDDKQGSVLFYID